MKILSLKEQKSIEQLFNCSQDGLVKVLSTYLKQIYTEIIATPNYIVAIGEIPIALVAHLDTVFQYGKRSIFYDKLKNVMWSPEGLGADDRAGVYAILQILKRGYRPTVIFTTDEERGAIGASLLTTDIIIPPVDIKYMIELDRQGYHDCVFYDCDNRRFEEYVQSFGFRMALGSFSDISILCPAWEIAGVNLSVGYKDEHSVSETLNIGMLFTTIGKVEKMLQDAENSEYFKYIPSTDNNWLRRYLQTWISTPNSAHSKECGCCHNWVDEITMYPTEVEGENIDICSECLNDASWCSHCGKAFLLPRFEYHYVCESCKAEALKEEKAANGES